MIRLQIKVHVLPSCCCLVCVEVQDALILSWAAQFAVIYFDAFWLLLYAALESLVEHKITGLPVVDEEGKVVGVVSDYDMLTLDNVSGRMEAAGIFPTASMDWEAFHEVQKLILKNTGKQ